MAKKKTTPRTTNPAPKPSVTIPVSVAALALFAAPGYDELPANFREAWAAMPVILNTLVAGKSDEAGMPSRDQCARDMFEADVAISRTTGTGYDAKLARAVDMLNTADPDLLGALQWRISDTAFYTGLAMGLYMMTNPAPIAVNAGGAR